MDQQSACRPTPLGSWSSFLVKPVWEAVWEGDPGHTGQVDSVQPGHTECDSEVLLWGVNVP